MSNLKNLNNEKPGELVAPPLLPEEGGGTLTDMFPPTTEPWPGVLQPR